MSYNSCQYSFAIASVGFNINCVTTQHTPKCVENGSGRKVSYNCLSHFTRFSVTSVITLKIAFFLNCALIILLGIYVCYVHRPRRLIDTECFC